MATCSESSDPDWWPQKLYCPQHDTHRYSNNPGKLLERITPPHTDSYNEVLAGGNQMDGVMENDLVSDDTVSYRSAVSYHSVYLILVHLPNAVHNTQLYIMMSARTAAC